MNSANSCLASGCRRCRPGVDMFVEKHSWSILPFLGVRVSSVGQGLLWEDHWLGCLACLSGMSLNQVVLGVMTAD